MAEGPTVAVFRPPDDRLAEARSILEARGAAALADPLVVPEPTGDLPRSDAAVTVLTSSTAADILGGAGWEPGGTAVAAIGPRTRAALEAEGFEVRVVPETYSSEGLVEALRGEVSGRRVEVARSDHGSPTLTDGLNDAGAYVHETVLYRLGLPDDAGRSVDETVAGRVDALAFTSSLTVERFLDLADDRVDAGELDRALERVTVGAIGEPTAATAADRGLAVDVVAGEATFAALADAILDHLGSGGSRSV